MTFMQVVDILIILIMVCVALLCVMLVVGSIMFGYWAGRLYKWMKGKPWDKTPNVNTKR